MNKNYTTQNNFIGLVKSHGLLYATPSSLNYLYNFGFLLFILMVLQIVSGVLITFFYSVNDNYYSILSLVNDTYFGYAIKFTHNNLPSLIFISLLIHIARGLYYNIYNLNSSTWVSGIILYCLVAVICYLGYVLPWGQISYWGMTVILNLLHPLIIKLISGHSIVSLICLKRYYILHFLLPFVLLIISVIHIFYLHQNGSSNPNGIDNKLSLTFTPHFILKDLFVTLMLASFLTISWDSLQLSHPDNLIVANSMKTPIHIVPEWYFLSLYALLKCIPNKNAGFLVMILTLLFLISLVNVNNTGSQTSQSNVSSFLAVNLLIVTYFIVSYIGLQSAFYLWAYFGRIFYVLFLALVIYMRM